MLEQAQKLAKGLATTAAAMAAMAAMAAHAASQAVTAPPTETQPDLSTASDDSLVR
jgi:hypothetical protein